MKEIKLTQGKTAIVDDKNFNELNKYKWFFVKCANLGYAARKKNGKRVFMHKEILGISIGKVVDHINHNSLDNRMVNLRKCSQNQNGKNRKISKNNKTGYKGVTWHSELKKWMACIRVNYKGIYLGVYKTAEKAARVYDKAAKKHYGRFATTNF